MNGLQQFLADPPIIFTGSGLSVLILLIVKRVRRVRLTLELND